MAKKPKTKTFAFGGCKVSSLSPAVADLSSETKMLNVTVSFEESLKLSLAIQECIRQLNSYNRGTAEGKATALNIVVHLHGSRITVNETTL